MQVKELIQQSWDALTRNRLRSILTMMGIVWGLTTVVLLLGYGQSVSAGVLNAFLGIGNNVIMVWEGQTSMQAGGQRAGKRIHFKYEDVEAIREEAPLVRMVSAEWDDPFPYKYGDRVVTVQSKAVQYPYGEMRKLNVAEGRYFEESDFTEHRHVLIVGPNAAKKVFGNRDPVGEFVTINGGSWEVIGLLRLKIQDSSNNGPDNENFFMPFESMSDINDRRDPEMIVFQAVLPLLHKAALGQVREVLARRHNFNPKDDKSTPEWDTVDDSKDIQQFGLALQLILGLIGTLTLGVGGVGVMNIMLVSVAERTREIGIRMSIGARERDILLQFLIEAVVLSLIGGLLGAALGMSATFGLGLALGWHMVPSPLALAVALVTSGGIGIGFGFFPARTAAKMDPIDALRTE